MSYFMRLLSIPVLIAMLWLGTGCGPAGFSVGVTDGYRYGDRRLPRDYFYADDYYDGYWYQDYVCYDDSWYYQGQDTPYYYDYDPYWW
ncbi:MAG: hypothetical protein M3R04_04900 [bacterium]|nr:hypothetical protein [bacterium]